MKHDESRKNAYEINYRSISAIREIGKGYSALSAFCGLMNLPPPMQIQAFNEMRDKVSEVYKQIADVSMQNAANMFNEKLFDINVSGDGSWQRKTYSSLNGMVTIIAYDSWKCLDYRVLSKTCSSCQPWEVRIEAEPELYQSFLLATP